MDKHPIQGGVEILPVADLKTFCWVYEDVNGTEERASVSFTSLTFYAAI